MSSTDPRPPSTPDAHTIYGRTPTTSKSRRARWIWIGLGVVAFALVLWYIFSSTAPAPTAGGPAAAGARSGGRSGRGGAGGAPTAVSGAKAITGDMPIYLNELGTVTPPATITIVPQISGVLQMVGFHEGQMVKKGQFLAQIDPRPYQQALIQAQGTLSKDQAALNDAQLDLKRYKTLLSQDSIGSQQVDTQAALVKQDMGQVENDKGAVATQRLNLMYCHITAPVAGRVGLRQVDPGNYITAGTTTGLVVITVLNPMDVLFTLPEDNLGQVAARVRSGASLAAVAFDRAQTTQIATGKLLTLDNQVDTTTGTVRAKARFDNHDGALFPNQFVNIRLTVDTLKNTIIVPTSAILKGPDGLFVYRVEKGRYLGSARVTPVKVGPAAGENTAITSGLETGDVVVTDGSDRLKDGARVVLPGDCLPSGAALGAGGRGGKRGAAGSSAQRPGGVFGLFAKKPAVDPAAALRCKPGQTPHSILDGSGGDAFNVNFAAKSAPAATGSTTTTTAQTTTTTASRSAEAPAAEAPASASHATPPAPAVSGSEASPSGEGHGGGRGGGVQAMIAALNLDAGQQVQAKAIFDSARQEAQSSGDPRSAFQAAFAKLEAILRPDQKATFTALRAQAAARRAQKDAAGGGQSDQ